MDTIFALSSGMGRSAIAIVRLSGPNVQTVMREMCSVQPEPRKAQLVEIRPSAKEPLIDRALVLWFPAPGSFTGEDSAEFHIHGSMAVVKALLTTLATKPGLRMAEPGEFARRAFENGKLDLSSVEGLADLIAAETDAQRTQALNQAGGALRQRIEHWRARLLALSAEIEARLDFADEDDVPDDLPPAFFADARSLAEEFSAMIESSHSAERVRSGYRVALAGLPNAGKSTLLNAMVQREVAIVTPEEGTTRDVLEVPLDLGGYPVILTDSAGIRATKSMAEKVGVERAVDTARRADLVLWVSDGSDIDSDNAVLADWTTNESGPLPDLWLIESKNDKDRPRSDKSLRPGSRQFAKTISISSITDDGLRALTDHLTAHVSAQLVVSGAGDAVIARQRQLDAIKAANHCLMQALDSQTLTEEFAAEHLRACRSALARITGDMGVEDVLDVLFSDFCIGK